VLALLALGGERPWMVHALVWSVFLFCLCRSIGAASGISWFYAILPASIRGRYFASDQFAAAVASIGTLLVCAGLFALLPVYWALLAQYLIALAGSTVSYFSLKRMPDADRPVSISLRTVLRDTPRHLLRPSTFRTYAWLAVACAVFATPIPPFAAYFLKTGAGVSTAAIMVLEVGRYSGVMVAAWLVRRRIDETGAKPFFLLALGIYAVVSLYWWFFLRDGFGGVVGVWLSYFLIGLGAATWAMANLSYLPKTISAEERTLAVAIHGAVTALIGGTSPVIWGLLLKGGEDRGVDAGMFQWFFVSVLGGAVVLSSLIARLPEDKGHPVEPIVIGNAILRPFRAMTYLASLVEPPKRADAPKEPPQGK